MSVDAVGAADAAGSTRPSSSVEKLEEENGDSGSRLTMRARQAKRTHGDTSQDVSNRWVGSQRSVPNLKAPPAMAGCCRSQSRSRSIASAGPGRKGGGGVGQQRSSSSPGKLRNEEREIEKERTDAMNDVQRSSLGLGNPFQSPNPSKTVDQCGAQRPNRAVKAVALGEIQAS